MRTECPESRRVAIDYYDWEILSISNQIKKLPIQSSLLIGSGIGNQDLTPVDINGSVFRHENHLWLDFDHLSTLLLFPDASIRSIVFDKSTFRYMHCHPDIIAQWHRILIDGGILCFEFGFACVSFGPKFSFEANPCHIKSPLVKSIHVYKSLSDTSFGIINDQENIYAAVSHSHQYELFLKLEQLFSSWNRIELMYKNYPFGKINVDQWIRVKK